MCRALITVYLKFNLSKLITLNHLIIIALNYLIIITFNKFLINNDKIKLIISIAHYRSLLSDY